MTTTNKLILGLVAVVLVVAGFALGHSSTGSQALGAVTNAVTHTEYGVWWFPNKTYFGSKQQTSIDTSGNIAMAPSTGTSTIATPGCIQMNATSTATTVKIVLSPTGATSTFNGTAYWKYGTCP